MDYYRVWVASSSYRGDESLTYSSEQPLASGMLVAVPLQKKITVGIVDIKTIKPAFTARPIKAVLDSVPLPSSFLELTHWIKDYYPSTYGQILLASLPSSLLTKPRTDMETGSVPLYAESLSKLPTLTDEQSQVLEQIGTKGASSFLLHGETGSGKTRIYLESAKRALEKNRSVLVMTPEIGLVPQLARIFETHMAAPVVVFHSMLTPGQRRDAWLRILHATEPLVVIGPRSALFTPMRNLGLIVMDEAHEAAYKQEQAPYYQTSRVAARLAKLHDCSFMMGTATPLVADYYAYEQKNLPILRLSALAIKDATPPVVTTVRLNDRAQFVRSSYLSEALLSAIRSALDAKEQSLVYLNRRGSARVILCQNCGWQALCPNCDSPLVYHGDEHSLRCHICGHKEASPNNCPDCQNTDITFRAIGTKAIVEELARIFPETHIQRFDTDNAKGERLENLFESVKEGKVDILVGTQILGKGLDLALLSVVGIVQADTSLLIPDYTADETTYQQLVQIIGRVGRGHRAGKVIIQSYEPEGVAVQAAIKRDYRLFYEGQLKERQLFGFPPFYYLLKLNCHRASSKSAETAASKLKDHLRTLNLPVEVIGPSPSFHAKRANQHYWQLVIKAKQRRPLLSIVNNLPSGWAYDIDPMNLL